MNRDIKSEKILARYATGERIFRDLDRDDGTYDFSHSDLRGAVFSGNHFFASFREANLECADFSHCNVKASDFSRANLASATFFGSAIDAAIFDSADLTGTTFEEASAFGYVFGRGELPPR
ncbi:pentapeptide repeat-containing protein [Rhizobium leguminosarum]|uniref:Pentapeptide repeat-containing protein n=1 Tax=Rhizobium leguminosarum TaxID=384 RepID=A0A2K9YYR0_RHILE|nr:pentapeptide repeat-containing protein [Rhizobium leguminosarum]AUW41135.1 Pentapeptide repeat-containing protein [Rhizobium leguminosarum]